MRPVYLADLEKRRQLKEGAQAQQFKMQLAEHGVNLAMFNRSEDFHTKEQIDEHTGLDGQLIETVTDIREPLYAYAWRKRTAPVVSNDNDENGIEFICVTFTDERSLSKKYRERSESFLKFAKQ